MQRDTLDVVKGLNFMDIARVRDPTESGKVKSQ